jgi:hypothetical protein
MKRDHLSSLDALFSQKSRWNKSFLLLTTILLNARLDMLKSPTEQLGRTDQVNHLQDFQEQPDWPLGARPI